MDILKLTDVGERLGLHGKELHDFVRAEQERERASRVLEREVAKENADRERENAERERLIARENAERDRDISKEKAELDFQLVEKKIELERLKANSNNSNASHETLGANQNARTARPKPRLPCFVDQKDKIDSYLQRFERFASNEGWEVESYGMYLSTLLTGKALEVYTRLPIALANDYGYLKKALLEKYQLTVDDYRRKFFSVRQSNGENCTNFWGDLEYNLDQWLGLSNVERTFEGLRELLLKEQFLCSCPKDMAIFLKEHAPVDQKSMLDLAEKYEMAHKFVGYDKARPIS